MKFLPVSYKDAFIGYVHLPLAPPLLTSVLTLSPITYSFQEALSKVL